MNNRSLVRSLALSVGLMLLAVASNVNRSPKAAVPRQTNLQADGIPLPPPPKPKPTGTLAADGIPLPPPPKPKPTGTLAVV
jgi:hypothetical protein